MKERIQLNDTMMDMIIKLGEGNPGALTVCAELYKRGHLIDPDSVLGPFTQLISLDTHNIYGPDIWMLYKDVCQQNLILTCAMLRGVQLGLLAKETLKHAIQNRGDGIDVQQVFEAVCSRLPNFNKGNTVNF